MNKTWLVMRNEILINVTRRSWLLLTFGLPVVLALVLFARPLLTGGGGATGRGRIRQPCRPGRVEGRRLRGPQRTDSQHPR
jgi:hypothetical protein